MVACRGGTTGLFASVLIACALSACTLTSNAVFTPAATAAPPTSTAPPTLAPAPLPTPTLLFSSVISNGQPSYAGIGLPAPGSTAVVYAGNDRLAVHADAGDNYGVIGYLQSFDQVTVVDGPRRLGAKTWWRVQRAEIDGWVAGIGQRAHQTLVPIQDFRFCGDTPLVAGGQAEVFTLDGALTLFQAAITTSPVLTTMPFGSRVDLVSGPQTVGDNIWWQVRYTDQTGFPRDGYAVGRSGNFCTLHPLGG